MKSSFNELMSHIESPTDRHILADLIRRNEVLRVRLLAGDVEDQLTLQSDPIRELKEEIKGLRAHCNELNAWWDRSKPIYDRTLAENEQLREENAMLNRQIAGILRHWKPKSVVLYQTA